MAGFVSLVYLLSWGGGKRSLYCMFCVVTLMGVACFSCLSFATIVLVLMVYISGLGVVFIYLVSVDLWSSLGGSFFNFILGVFIWSSWASSSKEAMLSYTVLGESLQSVGVFLGLLSVLVAEGFVFISFSMSKDGVCMRSF